MKEKKSRKSRSEEKVVGFSSAFLFPAMKREAVTQGVNRGIDHLPRRRTRESVSSNSGRTRETADAFQIH